jgi:phage-related protein
VGISQATLELLIQLKDEASGALGGIAGSLSSLGGVALGLAAGGVAAFGAAIVSGLGDAREADQLLAQTQAVITSTGNAAGTSAQHIVDYASSLSDAAGTSLFGDDQIQQSENLLLTFTNIKGASLDAATAMTVDLAQAMGGAPKDSAIQLGKALNDPIKGISALTKIGVTFTDEQKAQIAAMQGAGDMAGAQAVILGELNREFGGSAAAAANADGGMAQFTGRLGEAKEALGHAVIPLLNMLVGVLNANVMPIIESTAQAFGDFIKAFQTGASDGGGIIGGLSSAFHSLDSVSPIFGSIGDAIVSVSGIIGGIISTVSSLVSSFQSAGESSSSLGTTISTTLTPILGGELATAIGTFVDWLSIRIPEGITSVSNFVTNTLLPALSSLWTIIQTSILPVVASLVAQFLTVLPGAIDTIVALVSANLQPILVGLGAALLAIVVPAFIAWAAAAVGAATATIIALAPVLIPIAAIGAAAALLYAAWNSNFLGIQTIVANIWSTLQPIFANLIARLSVEIPFALQLLSGFWNNVLLPALNQVWSFIQNNILPIFNFLATVAIAIVKVEIQALAALWTNVLQPALNIIWGFIQNSLMPILQTLATVAIAVVKTEVQNLSNLWNNTLKPALDAVWGFISGSVIPVLQTLATDAITGVKIATQTLADLWNNIFKPAIETVAGLISGGLTSAFNTVTGIIHGAETAFDNVRGAVDSVIGTINGFISTLESVHVPEWLQGHSPPPMANWFSDISDSVSTLAGNSLSALQSSLSAITPGVSGITNSISGVMDNLISQVSSATNAIGNMFSAFGSAQGAASGLGGTVSSLGDSFGGISVPNWLEAHSPPPMAAWLNTIRQNAASLNSEMSNLMSGSSQNNFAFAGTSASGAGTQNVNLSITVDITGASSKGAEEGAYGGVKRSLEEIGLDAYMKRRLR